MAGKAKRPEEAFDFVGAAGTTVTLVGFDALQVVRTSIARGELPEQNLPTIAGGTEPEGDELQIAEPNQNTNKPGWHAFFALKGIDFEEGDTIPKLRERLDAWKLEQVAGD